MKFPQFIIDNKKAICAELGRRAVNLLSSRRQEQTEWSINKLLAKGFFDTDCLSDEFTIMFSTKHCVGDVFEIAEGLKRNEPLPGSIEALVQADNRKKTGPH
jgi:hypothetical protein